MANVYLEKALEKLNILRHSERELILKKEQQIAVENLLSGRDVLAVLPTGFGKSPDWKIGQFSTRSRGTQLLSNLRAGAKNLTQGRAQALQGAQKRMLQCTCQMNIDI